MECLRKTQFIGRRRWFMIAGLLAIALMAYSPAALADQTAPLLTPGMTSIPTITADDPGSLLASNSDTETCTAIPGGCAAGFTQVTVTSAVYQDTMTGFLNFYYQVYNSSTTTDPAGVQVVSMNNFGGYLTGVAYRDDGASLVGGLFVNTTPTADPELINRSTNPGDVVTYDYNVSGSNYIVPGDYSAVMVIETNATSYGPGPVHTNDGVALNFSAFQPAPEPASLALIGGGLLLLAGFRKAVKKH